MLAEKADAVGDKLTMLILSQDKYIVKYTNSNSAINFYSTPPPPPICQSIPCRQKTPTEKGTKFLVLNSRCPFYVLRF